MSMYVTNLNVFTSNSKPLKYLFEHDLIREIIRSRISDLVMKHSVV